MFDSEETPESDETDISILPLLMKSTSWIDCAFDTGLVVYLGDNTDDGELQVSLEESLSLQLAAEGVTLCFWPPRYKKSIP